MEKDPALPVSIDLESKTVTAGKRVYALEMPETYRLGLLSGQWDTTALLLDSLKDIKERHGDLPRFSKAAL